VSCCAGGTAVWLGSTLIHKVHPLGVDDQTKQDKEVATEHADLRLVYEKHNGNHVVLHPSDSPVTVAARTYSGRHHPHLHPTHAVAYFSTHIFVQSGQGAPA
jgi:hypothetical protein